MIVSDEILMQVEKPARYIGNEINMVKKNIEEVDMRFAFCFPDVYEVGMSHLGMQILYYFLNRREDTYCERAYTPWVDMEAAMRKNNIPLFSLETNSPLDEFDFLGFTLQYEMSYTNIVNMLRLSNIPVFSKDRNEDSPIICAGGPCAYNPEPLALIVDFFYIGEGEVNLDEILDIYKANKKSGGSRALFLEKILKVEGVYVPKFYDVAYKESGEIASFKPNHTDAPEKIKKVIVKDLDKVFYPEKQLVPLIEIVHDRIALEVFRGCIRGCRFCQAGYVYRPVREKESETLFKNAETLVESTGHQEISLLSLSTGDYSNFNSLAGDLLDQYAKDKINISLPSMRIDAFSLEIMERAQAVRKGSLTFAPEAGTQRLRDVINKGITEEEILSGSYLAFGGGWNRVKLYFMIGLPTENEDDLLGMVKLSEQIVKKYYELPIADRKRPVAVILSVACFVPKPFTPFQWEAQDEVPTFIEKHKLIKNSIVKKQIKFNYHPARLSVMEGVVARGDRRVGEAVARAVELGARFDGWTDHFKFEIWEQAFREVGLDMGFYAHRKRELTEILPWDFIDIGVTKEYFKQELESAYHEQTIPNCREACSNCGAESFGVGVCYGE